MYFCKHCHFTKEGKGKVKLLSRRVECIEKEYKHVKSLTCLYLGRTIYFSSYVGFFLSVSFFYASQFYDAFFFFHKACPIIFVIKNVFLLLFLQFFYSFINCIFCCWIIYQHFHFGIPFNSLILLIRKLITFS